MRSYKKRKYLNRSKRSRLYSRKKYSSIGKKLDFTLSPLRKDITMVKEVKYIVGPMSLTEHIHPKLEQRFLIFGDIHTNETKCPKGYNNSNTIHLNNYLKKLFKTKDENGKLNSFDFFVEFDYQPKYLQKKEEGIERYFKKIRRYGDDQYLSQVYNQFDDCFKIDKKDCKYKNVRFHYTDARIGKEIRKIVDNMWHSIEEFLEYIDYNEPSTDMLIDIKQQFKRSYKPDEIIKNLLNFETLLIKNKVDKQIENVPSNEIKYLLLDMRKDFIKEAKDLAKIYEDDVYDFFTGDIFENVQTKSKVKTLMKFSERLNLLHNKIMDMYTLGRIFRLFNDSSKNSKNIIIFAGDLHSYYYRKFLKKLGYKKINKTYSEIEGKDFQCIDVSKFSNNSLLIR